MDKFHQALNQAMALHQTGALEAALAAYKNLLDQDQSDPQLLFMYGAALFQDGQAELAISLVRRSAELHPTPIAHNNLGVMHSVSKNWAEAIDCFQFAIKLDPNYAEGYCNLGSAYREIKGFDKAIDCCRRAIQISPKYSQAYYLQGNILSDIQMYEDAICSYDKSIELFPSFSDAFFGKGLAHYGLGQFEDAIHFYDQAILLNEKNGDAYYNRANALKKIGRLVDALDSYIHAQKLTARVNYLEGKIFHLKMFLGIWDGFSDSLNRLKKNIEELKAVATPFVLHSLVDSPMLQRKCSEVYADKEYSGSVCNFPFQTDWTQYKIKIGYFSTDFSDHPVAHLLAGLFQRHDRGRFEVYAFSLKSHKDNYWKNRIIAGVDHFIETGDLSNQEVVTMAHTHGIQIAIDLNGYTRNARTEIFAQRVAPLQIGYLGFLGTMGAGFMDYIIADHVLIPNQLQEFYSEKIIYLPCYQCNDNEFIFDNAQVLSRRDYGLPEDAFVFCSFNNNYKITPATFEGWMRIIAKSPGSVLWLYVDNEAAKNNLLTSAERQGIDPVRIYFANRVPFAEHISRLQAADLFLDTFPYNAGATASNVLRVGLPIITRMGESFPSRYCASLLNGLDVQELVCDTQQSYEALAIDLASNRDKLLAIRRKLAENRTKTSLFDTLKFVKNLESAYEAIWSRYQAGLLPDHVHVGDTP